MELRQFIALLICIILAIVIGGVMNTFITAWLTQTKWYIKWVAKLSSHFATELLKNQDWDSLMKIEPKETEAAE